MPTFDPATDLPADLSSKTIVVTGGTAGLGKELVLTLCRHHSPRIFFTGRNASAGEALIREARAANPSANLTFVRADFEDLRSALAAGEEIASKTDRLDVHFANAGVMALPPGLSKDGFEVQFAVNHLGNSALLRPLLPVLGRTAAAGGDARVVYTTSLGYQIATAIKYDQVRTKQESWFLGGFQRYGQGKIGNLWSAAEIARRYPAITATSVTPGVIQTNIIKSLGTFNRWFTNITTAGQQSTVEEGVQSILWPAFAPKGEVVNGAFYEPVGKPGTMTAAAKDGDKAKELYDWTEKLLGEYTK